MATLSWSLNIIDKTCDISVGMWLFHTKKKRQHKDKDIKPGRDSRIMTPATLSTGFHFHSFFETTTKYTHSLSAMRVLLFFIFKETSTFESTSNECDDD